MPSPAAPERQQMLPTPAATLQFLSTYHPPTTAASLLADKLSRPLPLHPTPRDLRRLTRDTAAPARKRPQPLSARAKRATHCHALPKKGLVYADFLPLHELWVGYARELAAMGGGAAAMAQRLANADLHGALVEVVRCRCVDRVGVRGIVVRETRGAVEVVAEDGRVRGLLKAGTVFRVEVPVGGEVEGGGNGEKEEGRKMVFEIHGGQMMYRSGERAGKKFKTKPMKDL